MYRQMKLLLILLVCMGLMAGCRDVNGDGEYVPSFFEVAQQAERIYIGTIQDIAAPCSNPSMDEMERVYSEFDVQVQVEETLYGDVRSEQLFTDQLPEIYRDFITVGQRCVFCTGVKEESKPGWIKPYTVIKLKENGNLEIYQWEVYEKWRNSDYCGYVGETVKTLDEVRKVVGELYPTQTSVTMQR